MAGRCEQQAHGNIHIPNYLCDYIKGINVQWHPPRSQLPSPRRKNLQPKVKIAGYYYCSNKNVLLLAIRLQITTGFNYNFPGWTAMLDILWILKGTLHPALKAGPVARLNRSVAGQVFVVLQRECVFGSITPYLQFKSPSSSDIQFLRTWALWLILCVPIKV